ncbi:hypothetical protein QMK33_05805 [Hymenobacter sp. H14-R3]|uniref:hypothetical protein n=1 Tax=Hymenobacter sp. H14-R3 TaxID=3046308 RepID=UPI0024BA7E74|nr:hypothetical protein [Hymenobacter sp. H14-R3]MDJ0364660.1 hypothetical protein [Hymenobacter sp. H14-R3]
MVRLLVVVLAAVALAGCSQPKVATGAQPTSTSPAKINIPGTRLFLAPPAGFKNSTSFVGLERDEQTAVIVMDLMVGNYYKNAATFNRAEVEGKGVEVFDFQDTTISGYPAKYLFVQPTPATKAYWVVFGDSTFATTLMASFPTEDAQTGQQLKQAMLAATYDKKLKVDPFATAPFSLDESQSKFKFAMFSGNMYIYSIGGVKEGHQDPAASAVVTVTPLPADPDNTPAAMATLLEETLERNGLTDKKITNASTKRVNNYDAYEADVTGMMKGKKAHFYELFVTNGSKAVIIQGVIPAGAEGSAQAVRDFAHTVRLK